MITDIRKVLTAVTLAALLALVLAGCGGGQPNDSGGGGTVGPSAGDYLWEFSLNDQNLYIATINTASGELGTPTASGGIACNSGGTIPSVAVTPNDKVAFVIDKCLASIHVYTMSGPGVALTEIPESPYFVANVLDSIAMDPSGKSLYAMGTDPGAIYQFSVSGGTGELTLNSTTMVNGDIRQVVAAPQGSFLFINDLTDGKILAYAIGSGGTPSAVSGSPFTVPSNDQPENLAIDSGGRFLYAPVIQGGIVAFSVNGSTGALTEIAGSPFSTSDQPFTLAIAPSAKYLYSIGATSNSAIDAFEIDAETGALSVVQGSPFAAPSALNSLTVDSSGSYLYATAQVDMQANSCLYGYAIDPATGGLTALATSPYPAPTFPVNALSLSIP